MKSQLLVVALLGFLLGGCTTFKTVSVEDSCNAEPSDKPKIVRVKFREKKDDESEIEAPPRACVYPGDLLVFRIDTRDRKNANVSGKEEDTANAWIRGGTRRLGRWFWVTVPYDILDTVPPSEDFKDFFYDIDVDDFPGIDPEVRVRRPN